jgi:hypothetical protein
MRNKIIVLGAIGVLIYVMGSRSHRPVSGKNRPETIREQAERLIRDPKAAKNRRKLAKKAQKRVSELAKNVRS